MAQMIRGSDRIASPIAKRIKIVTVQCIVRTPRHPPFMSLDTLPLNRELPSPIFTGAAGILFSGLPFRRDSVRDPPAAASRQRENALSVSTALVAFPANIILSPENDIVQRGPAYPPVFSTENRFVAGLAGAAVTWRGREHSHA